MQPCKFALKVWNAQQAGATGVSFNHLRWRTLCMIRALANQKRSALSAMYCENTDVGCGNSQHICSVAWNVCSERSVLFAIPSCTGHCGQL